MRNFFHNGNLNIWDINTSFSNPTNGTETANLFFVDLSATIATHTISRQSFSDSQVDVPGYPNYYLRWNVTDRGAEDGTLLGYIGCRTPFVRDICNRIGVLTFWARSNQLYQADVKYSLEAGSGGTPLNDFTNTLNMNLSIGTSWNFFKVVTAIPPITGIGDNGDSYFFMGIEGVKSTGFLDIARVQFEVNALTSFEDNSYDPYVRI